MHDLVCLTRSIPGRSCMRRTTNLQQPHPHPGLNVRMVPGGWGTPILGNTGDVPLDRVPFWASSFGTGCLFLASRIVTGCLFKLPALAPALTCFLLISQAILSQIPSLFPSLTEDSLNISEQNIKQLENTIKTRSKLVLINYTITQSTNSVFISKLGQGVFLAMGQIPTGSDFDNAGGTPLPISKASAQFGVKSQFADLPAVYTSSLPYLTHICEDFLL